MYSNQKPSRKKQQDFGKFVSEALGDDTGLSQSPTKAPYKGGLPARDLGGSSIGGTSQALGLDSNGYVQSGKAQKKPFMSSESMTRDLATEKRKRKLGGQGGGVPTFGN